MEGDGLDGAMVARARSDWPGKGRLCKSKWYAGSGMRVPQCWLRVMVVLLLGSPAAQVHAAEHKAAPAYQLPLQSLGYAGSSAAFLENGSSVLTVNYLDDSHLLLTFSLRKLIPRLPGDPSTDEDRLVAAEVVDLPSGKIEAHTEWHLHDHARYLWALGDGRFLVRIAQQLYAIAPLANLATPDPFQMKLFPNHGDGLTLLMASPDGGVVTEETAVHPHPPPALGDAPVATDQSTLVDFFRLHGDGSSDSPLVVTQAGRALAPQPIFVALDADGYLWAKPSGSGQWDVGFDSFVAKGVDLGTLRSSCAPRLEMVSPSEYVAMTCQGNDDNVKIASYGLDGHETWEEPLGNYGLPTFVHAFSAGRFALSHTTVSTGAVAASGLPVDAPETHQEVRVYQNGSGDLLLKLDCSPAYKTAENFDLSADGSQVAVAQGNNLAVYKLPPPSKQDLADMAEVAKYAPPAGSGPVLLTRLTTGGDSGEKAGAIPAPALPAATQTVSPTASSAEAASGDTQTARKPPTLLNPGEKAEMPGKQ